MNLTNKYIKCFSLKKKEELENAGFSFLFQKAGVWYFKNQEHSVSKFSDNKNILQGCKYSTYIPL